MTPGPLQARFNAAFTQAERAAALGLRWLVEPAANFEGDVARFVCARMIVFAFPAEETRRLAASYGWAGHLSALGLDPDRAFARYYDNGACVVAVWTKACATEGRPS